MKIALVSPLPPTHSGVADYAARLGRELTAAYEVIECDPPDPARIAACDVALYHMGNSGTHGLIYEASLTHPGVVVLHDTMLHHFALGWFPEAAYIEEFVYNYGEWFRSRAEELWRDRRISAGDQRYFRYPMLRRLIESSRAVIVHNPAAARMARQSIPVGKTVPPIHEVPHFVDKPSSFSNDERNAVREDLGVTPDEVLISCLGYLRPAKRVRAVLDACASLDGPYRLLIGGEFSTPEYEAALAPRFESDRIIRRPYLDDTAFERVLGATDIGVNLRFPSAGETSGLVMRMMSLGKPVLVTGNDATGNDENAAFPDDAVIRVDPGEAETDMLRSYLRWLIEEPAVRARIGQNAAAHVNSVHSLWSVAARYGEILRQAAAVPRQ